MNNAQKLSFYDYVKGKYIKALRDKDSAKYKIIDIDLESAFELEIERRGSVIALRISRGCNTWRIAD